MRCCNEKPDGWAEKLKACFHGKCNNPETEKICFSPSQMPQLAWRAHCWRTWRSAAQGASWTHWRSANNKHLQRTVKINKISKSFGKNVSLQLWSESQALTLGVKNKLSPERGLWALAFLSRSRVQGLCWRCHLGLDGAMVCSRVAFPRKASVLIWKMQLLASNKDQLLEIWKYFLYLKKVCVGKKKASCQSTAWGLITWLLMPSARVVHPKSHAMFQERQPTFS